MDRKSLYFLNLQAFFLELIFCRNYVFVRLWQHPNMLFNFLEWTNFFFKLSIKLHCSFRVSPEAVLRVQTLTYFYSFHSKPKVFESFDVSLVPSRIIIHLFSCVNFSMDIYSICIHSFGVFRPSIFKRICENIYRWVTAAKKMDQKNGLNMSISYKCPLLEVVYVNLYNILYTFFIFYSNATMCTVFTFNENYHFTL